MFLWNDKQLCRPYIIQELMENQERAHNLNTEHAGQVRKSRR